MLDRPTVRSLEQSVRVLEEIVKVFRQIVQMFRQTVKAFGQNITALEKLLIISISFVKDNKLSLVDVFPKKKVTYLGGQVGDQV